MYSKKIGHDINEKHFVLLFHLSPAKPLHTISAL